MDYEKLHKDTINKLQQMVNSGKITVEIARGICADFVPESEEERTRKEILDYIIKCSESLYDVQQYGKERFEKWIAWLEKQGEQKPAWSEKDEHILNNIYDFVAENLLDKNRGVCADECLKWLKSLTHQSHWKPSDEQIKVCKEVYADLLSAKGFDVGTINSELNRLEEQLKKLKE